MLAVLKRNEKGLTLIELLAVLVIIGIIAAIAIPAIGGTITNAREKANVATAEMIEEAAQRYYMDLLVSGDAVDANLTVATHSTAAAITNYTGSLRTLGYLAKAPEFSSGVSISSITVTLTNGVHAVSVALTGQ